MTAKAISYFEANRSNYLEELKALVRIPSVSFDGFDPAEVRRSAMATLALLKEKSLENVELLEIEGHPRDRLRLVLNQITPATPMLPQDVSAIVNHPVFWTIPYSAQVPESTASGRPIVLSNPKTDTAKQLRGLAEQLTGVAVPQRDLRALLRPGHLLRRSA